MTPQYDDPANSMRV